MLDRAGSSHGPFAVVLACLLAAALPGAAAEAPAPPASRAEQANPKTRPPVIAPEVFARPAAYTGMRLSPLGRQAVARSIVDGKECLVVIDLETGNGRVIALPPQVSLLRFGWAGEHRVLFSFGASVRWFDSEAYASRLMVYDLRTNASTFIGRRDGGLEGDDVIYVDPDGDRRSRKDWRTTVEGDGSTDLERISPLFGVAELRVPVLLAHGDEDQVVPIRLPHVADRACAAYYRRQSTHGRMIRDLPVRG